MLVTGSAALTQEVRALGLKVVQRRRRPEAVIQGFEPALGWKDLAEAAFAVNAGAVWVATNTDMSIPAGRGIAPGNGTLVAAVRPPPDRSAGGRQAGGAAVPHGG